MAWRRKRIHASMYVENAEALAAKLAIRMAQEMNFGRIIIEGDCSVVINSLNTQDIPRSTASALYAEIQQSCSQFTEVSFRHIRR